jgi:hypothetical protein
MPDQMTNTSLAIQKAVEGRSIDEFFGEILKK